MSDHAQGRDPHFTREEQSKRGELHSKLCALIEEHGMHELLWMVGQIMDDRGERVFVDEGDESFWIVGEHLQGGEIRNPFGPPVDRKGGA